MTGTTLTVLYVDPDNGRRVDVTDHLADTDGIEALGVDGIDSAEAVLRERRVDCLVSEHDLGTGTGLELFRRVRDDHPGTACILYTDASLSDIGTTAFADVIAEFLPRDGATGDRLVTLVRNVVANRTQVGYPVPDTETARLAAVRRYDLAELSTVETFDRITHLAATHFDIAVAFIGLVGEDTEEFLACHGADWQTLTREDSICTYSILEESVTLVPDVAADPRFEHNETLDTLGIRSYAGANLTAPSGEVIGELCLVHDEPRAYDDEEVADMQLFADEAMEQLELRRRLSERDDEQEPGGREGPV